MAQPKTSQNTGPLQPATNVPPAKLLQSQVAHEVLEFSRYLAGRYTHRWPFVVGSKIARKWLSQKRAKTQDHYNRQPMCLRPSYCSPRLPMRSLNFLATWQ